MPPWMIEKIERERREREERERQQPQIPLHDPYNDPPPAEKGDQPAEEKRGPITIPMGGDDDEEDDNTSGRSGSVHTYTISLI